MRFTAADPEDERARYKVVRTDTMMDVPGLILSADPVTGLCMMRDATGETKEYNFGPRGLVIILARR
jgi:hypothetical protein